MYYHRRSGNPQQRDSLIHFSPYPQFPSLQNASTIGRFMALSEIQQATALIDRATDVLLVVPQKASIDSLASLLALSLALGSRQPRTPTPSRLDVVSPSHLRASLRRRCCYRRA